MSFLDAPPIGHALPRPFELDLVHPSLPLGYPWLFTDRVHPEARSIYDIDLLNIHDIRANIHLLDREPDKAAAVRAILGSDFDGHYAEEGMKHHRSLPAHLLLLLLGRGVDRLPRYGTRIVTCCLRDQLGHYSPDNVNLRYLNPRCARRDRRKFLRRHNLPALFDEGFEARILLLESPHDIQTVGEAADNNADTRRSEFREFFNRATDHLNSLIKRGRVRAYLAGAEVSCQSIWHSQFFPHVHAIVWTPANANPEWLYDRLPDRVTLARPGGAQRDYAGIERFVDYLYRVNSLTRAYARERDAHDLTELNRRTVNAWESMITLLSKDADNRAFRRIRYRQLPAAR